MSHLEPRKQKRAQKRARTLLLSNLHKQQRRTLKRKGHFDVISSKGNVYRIATMLPYNVRLVGDAKPSRMFFCLEAEDPNLPVEDVLLAQKLMLENDEGEFLRLANMAHIPK
ncbi:MAG: hypothetical protein NVS4B2_32510 [Chloroflexota bacterium]